MPAAHHPGHHDPGHTVLAVPVPELDAFVRARTVHYDSDYLAANPQFGQAHITVLGPWLREPQAADLAVVAHLAARTPPFRFRLAELGVFPNGIIHLRPEPRAPFDALTAAMVARFPQCPPYAGQFAEPVPHLTLDAIGPGIDRDVVRAMLGDRVPTESVADQVQLQWWQAGHCHLQRAWKFAATGDDR